MVRKIIHIDMDAFYASVEQRDNPSLKGKPVAVGGSRQRGVVAAASYEARKFGVRSAMASAIAYRKCPHITFVKPRFDVYKSVSQEIREVFAEYTDLIEPLSLDEAYLDVTQNKKSLEYAMDVATEIRAKIKERTGLTSSAGVSFNKFLAKVASDVNKPNGMYVITPMMSEKFIDELPIERFFGVGKVTAEKMRKRGINNGLELKSKSEKELVRWFGKVGRYYYQIVRGIDDRPVNPNRIRKSLGAERTFEKDLLSIEEIQAKLDDIVETVWQRIERANVKGRTLTLKIKYADFQQITRSKTELENLNKDSILSIAYELSAQLLNVEKGVRLIGLQVSNFEHEIKEGPTLGQLELIF